MSRPSRCSQEKEEEEGHQQKRSKAWLVYAVTPAPAQSAVASRAGQCRVPDLVAAGLFVDWTDHLLARRRRGRGRWRIGPSIEDEAFSTDLPTLGPSPPPLLYVHYHARTRSPR